MLVEADARRFVSDAIESERELKSLETREKAKGRILIDFDEYHMTRDKLVRQIHQLNAVVNVEDSGRKELSVDVLLTSEAVLRRVSDDQSRAVCSLAEQIRNSFLNLRSLLRKYEEKIEIVDPQLKNNPELVEALAKYENYWEKGRLYLLDGRTCGQLICSSQIIEAASEKYKEFQEQIKHKDFNIYTTSTCLLILKSLEDNDNEICKSFLPCLEDPNHRLGQLYHEIKDIYVEEGKKGNYYEYYNHLERLALNIPVTDTMLKEESESEKLIHNIKQLSIELQSSKPSEWNRLLDVLLDPL